MWKPNSVCASQIIQVNVRTTASNCYQALQSSRDYFANNNRLCPAPWAAMGVWLTSDSGWVSVTLKGCPLSWPRMWLFRLYWLLKVFSQPLLGQLKGFSPTIRLETEREEYRNSQGLIFNVREKKNKTRASVLFQTFERNDNINGFADMKDVTTCFLTIRINGWLQQFKQQSLIDRVHKSETQAIGLTPESLISLLFSPTGGSGNWGLCHISLTQIYKTHCQKQQLWKGKLSFRKKHSSFPSANSIGSSCPTGKVLVTGYLSNQYEENILLDFQSLMF